MRERESEKESKSAKGEAEGTAQRHFTAERHSEGHGRSAEGHKWNSERGAPIQQKGVLRLQSNDALIAQNKLITQQLENLSKILEQLPQELKTVAQVQSQLCELCGGDHINGQCAFPVEAVEDVNYMTNQYRQGSYNQGWKPHPSIGQEQSGQAGQTGQFNKQQQQTFLSGSLDDTLQQFLKNSDSTQKSIEESCKRMEMHLRYISQRLNEEVNTEVNFKEEGQAIVIESEKIFYEEKLERDEEKVERKEKEELSEKNKDEEKEKEVVEREERKKICVKIKKLKRKRKGKKKIKEKKKRKFGERKRKKKKMRGKKKKSYEKSHPHLKKNHRKEKKFKCFMEIFKKLEIKVPMIETLQQVGMIPNFAPQFGEQVLGNDWGKLATYPAPANIAVVKEFYTNAKKIGDYPAENYLGYVRGHAIRYDPDSINNFLDTVWAGEQCQFALCMEEGADFEDVERVLCIPGGHFQRNRSGSVVNIRRTNLNPLAKYWMAFSHVARVFGMIECYYFESMNDFAQVFYY
ncbi:hypothetical protein LR48_Vigan04g020900 [Vigna angularis]|uniref:Putative plant transposon protein domain-containing protein n=1 Tax=Phaseolus angularis TaxID=3914 RepID=A0A0L9UBF6_PHAAN|nr:hypothetical protein LR48_Vigan04g020900 [Vigna angularis]